MNTVSHEAWQRFLKEAVNGGAKVLEIGTSKACIDFGTHAIEVGFSPVTGIHISRGFNFVTLAQGLGLFRALALWEDRALHPERV
jgi:hypothetical protein